jgi:ApbE superfamily uncharacterized protein (UPF0280 family)
LVAFGKEVVSTLKEAAAVTAVMLRLAEAEWAAASLTNTVKGKAPVTVVDPEIAPAEDKLRPVGSVPLESDHE